MDTQNEQPLAHSGCFVCGKSNTTGLSVQYRAEPDGRVVAVFCGSPELEGYQGLLHGGIIAALLDGAMTNCLFAHGHFALTVELNVRYRAGVQSCTECLVRAELAETRHGVFRLNARLEQNGIVKVLATGKFMPKPGGDSPHQQL